MNKTLSKRWSACMRFLIVILAGLITACQQPATTSVIEESKSEPDMQFDSTLAKHYGADDYGMKKYVMAFLKKGPNRDLEEKEAQELQMAHLANITKMADDGKLVLAGPFFDDGDTRGIYIFNVNSIKEAEALTNTDPAIKAGSLEMELREWYGSAALIAVNNLHKKVAKKGVTD